MTPIKATLCAAALACLSAVCATAASLSPLDGTLGGDFAFVDPLPAPDTAPMADPVRTPIEKPTFHFVDDDVLTGDPLRDILPEDQWANPRAAQNQLLQRR